MTSKNPFVDEPQRSHWLTKYPSDTNYRVVWLKGKKAKVPGLGSFRCPIYDFDSVAFVWMHDRTIPVDLSSAAFSSEDCLGVHVQVTITARVQENDLALIATATCFEESLAVLNADVVKVVSEFCRSRHSKLILGSEKAFAIELKEALRLAPSSSTFAVHSVIPQFRIPVLEKAAEHDATDAISYDQETKKQARETELSRLRATRNFAELDSRIREEWATIEAECKTLAERAKTAREQENARLDYIKNITELTEASKTAVLHLDREMYRDVTLAELTNRKQTEHDATERIMTLMRSLAEITKHTPSVTTVVGTNIPNTAKNI